MSTPPTLGPGEIAAALETLVEGIGRRHPEGGDWILLGIANGGIPLAERLGARLRSRFPRHVVHVGSLDISFHRDDIGRHPIPKEFSPTLIPVDVDGALVILVDDVLFSGRTVKAALEELFDHGRPATVELAVLVDRGGRRLPIAAEYVGLALPVPADQQVIVTLTDDPAADRIVVRQLASAQP